MVITKSVESTHLSRLETPMKKIDVGQAIGVLANAGVIGGLLVLAFEVRQNTAQMRAQAAYSINESVETLNQAVFQDREFADLLLRGEQSFDELDAIDRRRLAAYFYQEIDLADYILKLEEEGLSDLHFDYVDFKIEQFRSSTGRREFVKSVVQGSNTNYFGSAELYNRLVAE
jgi:hypothetical protein